MPGTTPRCRIATVLGTVAALPALASLAAGSALLWANAKKDGDGYLATAHEPFAASTYALATDDLDVDLDGAGGVVRHTLGKVRVQVEPRAGRPVFVGIGRTLGALVIQALSDYGGPLVLPLGRLVAFTTVAVIAGIGAAIMPARRASRSNVLDALHYA